jgi:hypothetical protein
MSTRPAELFEAALVLVNVLDPSLCLRESVLQSILERAKVRIELNDTCMNISMYSLWAWSFPHLFRLEHHLLVQPERNLLIPG